MTTRCSTDVVVVGAGLAGLTAAAFVAERGRTVTVLERRKQPGGLARTDERNGFLFNRGPHALYRSGSAAAGLAELGIRLSGSTPPTRGRLLLEGALHRLPAGPGSLMTTRAFGPADKIEIARLMTSIPRIDPRSVAELTARTWIDELVQRPRVRHLLEAVVRLNTYANLLDVMSADVAVSQIALGLASGVRYLDHGWQSIIEALSRRPGVQIVADAGVDRLEDLGEDVVVIVAVGGPGPTGRLIGREFDVGPPAEVGVVDLGLSRRPPHDIVLGGDVPFYLSNHSAAAVLAPAGSWSVSALGYLGDDDAPSPSELDDWIAAAGVDAASVTERRRLHRMAASSAVALASHGGMAARPAVDDTGIDHVVMAGDWIGPSGHLADATVASARAAAQAAVRRVDERATGG